MLKRRGPSMEPLGTPFVNTVHELLLFEILTLNVPGDCGSARPTRVEPRLYCVGIAWQVRGKCGPLTAPRNYRPRTQCGPRNWTAAHALCSRAAHEAFRAFPRILRATQSAARALCDPTKMRAHVLTVWQMQFAIQPICHPRKLRPKQLIMSHFSQSSNHTNGFPTLCHLKTLLDVEIMANSEYIWRSPHERIVK